MRLIRSFGYAFEGIWHCYTKELNFRIHVTFMLLAISAGFGLKISVMEWIILSGCIAMVLILEMLNTAIERLCDIVSPSRMPQIKIIKDIAAGAVLLGAVASVCIGSFIFFPKIVDILK
jgi:diacylglycerol kinase